MKLVYQELVPLMELEENKVTVLIVEDPVTFRKLTMALYNQVNGEDGNWVLSVNGKVLSLEKQMSLLTDFLNFDYNTRKVLTALYNELQLLAVDEKNFLDTAAFKSSILAYVDNLLTQVDYPLIMDEDFKLNDLFKLVNVRFESNEADLLEKLVDYLEVCGRFLKLKVVGFVNLKSFLSIQELEQLYQEAFYKKIQLFLLEPREALKNENEKIVIIDNDLCVVKNDFDN